MPISKDGWLDWAIVAPGIPDKIYSEPNKGIGIIGHSIVGSYQSAIDRFMSTYRDPDGSYSDYSAASVMFIITYWGELIQMYPITASTWTSGTRAANTSYWAVELEGGYASNPSEPMTRLQVMCMMRLAREWEAYKGQRFVIGEQFREHREFAPTACPSNRYELFKIAWVMEQQAQDAEEAMPTMDYETEIIALQGRLQKAEADVAFLIAENAEQGLRLGQLAAYDQRLAKILGAEFYEVTYRSDMPDRVKNLFPAGVEDGYVHELKGADVIDFADWMGLSVLQAIRNLRAHIHDDPADIPHQHGGSAPQPLDS